MSWHQPARDRPTPPHPECRVLVQFEALGGYSLPMTDLAWPWADQHPKLGFLISSIVILFVVISAVIGFLTPNTNSGPTTSCHGITNVPVSQALEVCGNS